MYNFIESISFINSAVHSTSHFITPPTEQPNHFELIVMTTGATVVTLAILVAVIAATVVCTRLFMRKKKLKDQGQQN